ncbi:MAG: alpha-N-arabinofuranosidase [Acidobacteriia bacterium]|nr:alpha-N-arabinofuranosidase [Terriglobia bacterium]
MSAQAQVAPVTANIDASRTGAPISRSIYGQFLEHIGGIVNNGVWAEMLEDRKFYYPVTARPAAAPAQPRRGPVRRWTPIGPDESIVMDTNRPYVGDHSPLVKLNGAEPRGIQQTGLAVRKGKFYAGRVILAGDPGARVSVTLVWGAAASDRQTVTVGKLAGGYAKFPLKLQAQADTDNARLEIVGTGAGAFHVGAVSLMPADNTQGFRTEVIAALKQLRSGVYRFPGGNFVSAHEWRYAIGDPDKRPPILDPVWNAVQPNDVGTDEFLTLCRLLDVEPYITVNAGFGDAWSAAQEVEYVNGAATTPMGRLRAANGHPQPYGVKLWGIGNEMFGDWQFGFMAQEQYQVKHNLFAKAMRQADASIQLLASGAMPDHMTGSKWVKQLTGKPVPEYLGPGDWTGGLLTHCFENIDMLSEHYYAYSNRRFDLEKGEQVSVPNQPLVEWARQPANFVRAKYEHYQEYLARIPALKAKPIPVSISEWAYTGAPANSQRVVLAYAWAFQEMFRHSELFRMATFTFATSLLSSNRTEAVLNPSGLMFKLYRDHFGTIPVKVSGNSPQPAPAYPAGGQQPKVNPGTDTYPLDVAAALGADRKTLSVAVVNPTESEQQLNLAVTGVELTGQGRLWRMAPASLNASIVVGQKPGVEVEERALEAAPKTVAIAPFSVSIYELALR